MLRRLIIVTFAGLLCLYLPAASAENITPDGATTQLGGALFKVQDGQHSLYLFGTIHVGAADFYPLAPALMHALEQAPALALEIDPANSAALQAAVLQYGLYPPNQGTVLGAPLQQQLTALLDKFHISPATVARMRPWMIASLLTVQDAESHGYRSELAVDAYLANIAQQQHKPVIELEGAVRQLALLGALNDHQQSLLLQDTIKEINDAHSATELTAITQCWRHGDLHGLQDMLVEMAADESFAGRFTKEVMIDQRNPFLADRLVTLLTQQDGIVAAMGILHLAGANSVPALLQQRGLKVERIF